MLRNIQTYYTANRSHNTRDGGGFPPLPLHFGGKRMEMVYFLYEMFIVFGMFLLLWGFIVYLNHKDK